jgi:hypothetical protein
MLQPEFNKNICEAFDYNNCIFSDPNVAIDVKKQKACSPHSPLCLEINHLVPKVILYKCDVENHLATQNAIISQVHNFICIFPLCYNRL